MTTIKTPVRAGVAALLALALTACSDSSDNDGGDSTSTTGSQFTAPGTHLEVGEPAMVPLRDNAGVMALTVTSIQRGTTMVSTPNSVPYYVRLTATVVSGDGHEFFAEWYISAWSNNERVMPVAKPAVVGPCARAGFHLEPPVGTTIEPCLTFLVPENGPPVDRVAFYSSLSSPDYQIGDNTTVEWSLPPDDVG